MADLPNTKKPWQWPGVWMRDEDFWRDVGSRTLATVFAAAIVYTFALAAGYVRSPNGVDVLLLWVAPAALAAVAIYMSERRSATRRATAAWLFISQPLIAIYVLVVARLT
jgi:hypothetical protein